MFGRLTEWGRSFLPGTTTEAYDNQRVNLRTHSYEFILNGISGYTRVLDTYPILTVLKSPRARSIYSHATMGNVVGALSWMMSYEVGKYAIRRASSDDATVVEPTLYYADMLATMFFCVLWARMLVHNTTYDVMVAKVVADIDNDRRDNEPVVKASQGAMLQAAYQSPAIYLGTFASALVYSYLPGGYYATLPLYALMYGQAFIEYDLAAKGMSIAQRTDVFAGNHAYALGLGFSFMSLTGAIRLSLASVGVNNFFINSIGSAMLFRYFMLLEILRKESLPGKGRSYDVSHFIRANSIEASTFLVKTLAPHLVKSKTRKQISNSDVRKALQSLLPHLSGYRTIDRFLEDQMMRDFMSLFRKGIYEGVKKVRESREATFPNLVNDIKTSKWSFGFSLLEAVLPGALLEDLPLLKIVFNREVPKLLNQVARAYNHTRDVQGAPRILSIKAPSDPLEEDWEIIDEEKIELFKEPDPARTPEPTASTASAVTSAISAALTAVTTAATPAANTSAEVVAPAPAPGYLATTSTYIGTMWGSVTQMAGYAAAAPKVTTETPTPQN